MSRRTELEKEVEIARRRLEGAHIDTPEEILDLMREELDSASFELNNLYDDREIGEE